MAVVTRVAVATEALTMADVARAAVAAEAVTTELLEQKTLPWLLTTTTVVGILKP
jgi:hypothetical protein